MIFILIVVMIIVFFAAIIITNARNANNIINFEINSNETQYNPATGLPMIGALDSMGNSIGTSSSDRDNYWNNDYHHSTYNSSSYDPFSNRY
ncbi:TPA: hypothetical protein I8669_002768 [Legionella pneumophila]|nr:hypothetical protein [Legionella pneumophila]